MKNVLRQKMIPHIQEFVKGWQGVKATDLNIITTTGLTNETLIVEQTQGPVVQPEKIIFRFYGDKCEGLYLDRQREIQIITQLSEQQIGPKIYGSTDKIRIEEFLPSELLQTTQMQDESYYRKVAFSLAKFHQANIKEISTQPCALKAIDPDGIIVQMIRDKLNSDIFDSNEIEMVNDLKTQFSDQELDFILTQSPKDFSKVCFSHNDLLANNILVLDQNHTVKFIDFEYSEYNYRGFDIGNYFSESQFDYSNPNPPYFYFNKEKAPLEIVEDFIRVYTLVKEGHLRDSSEMSEQKLDEIEIQLSVEDSLIISQVKKELLEEYQISRLLSHMFWGGWAIHMSHSSEIQFDYLRFAYERYQLYKSDKQQLLQQSLQ